MSNLLKKLKLQLHLNPLFKGTILLSGFTGLSYLLTFMTRFYLVRNLSKANLSLLDSLLSTVNLLSVFIPAYMIWSINHYPYRKKPLKKDIGFIGNQFLIMSVLSLGMGGIIFLFHDSVFFWYKFSSKSVLFLFVLYLMGMYWTAVFRPFFQIREYYFLYSLGNSSSEIVKASMVAGFLFITGLTITKVMFAFCMSAVFPLIFFGWMFYLRVGHKAIRNFFFSRISKKWLSFSEIGDFFNYFISMAIIQLLLNADMILVRFLLPIDISANYAVATLFGRVIISMASIPLHFFHPLLVKARKNDGNIFQSLSHCLLISGFISLFCLGTLNLVLPYINEYFLVGKYTEANSLIRLHSVVAFLFCITHVYMNFLIGIRAFKKLIPLLIFPFAQATSILLWGRSAMAVAWINLGVNSLMIIVFLFYHHSLFKREKNSRV